MQPTRQKRDSAGRIQVINGHNHSTASAQAPLLQICYKWNQQTPTPVANHRLRVCLPPPG